MTSVNYCFHGLNGVIDAMHGLFKEWDSDRVFYPPLDALALERTKIAVHEWLANLVQHADFGSREPEVRITLETKNSRVECTIEDNSQGFDVEERMLTVETVFHELPDSFPERGMGLMLVVTSTEDLTYIDVAEDRHRLKFFVSS